MATLMSYVCSSDRFAIIGCSSRQKRQSEKLMKMVKAEGELSDKHVEGSLGNADVDVGVVVARLSL